jgi:Rod binding domain-containing protein
MDGIRTTTGAGPAQSNKPVDDQSRQKLQRATKEFESLLVGYMLKSMRSSLKTSDMFGDSYGGDVLDGLFDGEMAKHVSQNSSLGLAETLYRKMTGEAMPHKAAPVRHPSGAISAVTHRAKSAPDVQPSAQGTAVTGQKVSAVVVQKTSVPQTIQASPVLSVHDSASPAVVTPDTTQVVPDSLQRRLDQVAPLIQEAASTHGVDGNLLKAIIATESGGNAQARSPRNAKGLMQLIDSTATAMGVRNVWNPRENVLGGAKYLSKLMEQFGGDREKAVASYNAGPGAVVRHGGVPPFKETRAYVDRVMNYMRLFEQQESGNADQD